MPTGWVVAVGAMAVCGLIASRTARADEAREERLEREIERLRARLEALEEGGEAGRGAGAPGSRGSASAAGAGAEPDPEVEPLWTRDAIDTPAGLRGVYDKPFLVNLWRRAYLGGYAELEYHGFDDEVLGLPRGFRMHRTNLFLYGDVTDRVRFASEIELESEEPGEDLEVALEMAFLDWVLFEELTVRGGAILAPLGRVNVNHDGPVRELTDRPLVSTFVIPTTMTEAGVGLVGTIRLGDAAALSYEAYLTNGFALLDRDGEMAAPITEREALLREGRPSLGGDFNPHPATMGRVGLELFDALAVGGSWHVGRYDERGNNTLTLLAADLTLALGPFGLEGELAWAGFERDGFARTAGIPDNYWGYYVQGSLGGMPGFLRRAVPYVFDDEGASVGVAVRFDHIDLDGDLAQALEPGVFFRPFADTIFKLSYRFGFLGLGVRDGPGREGLDDDGFVFGLATYF